jgi:Cu(I)/Ag(I) efflux system membrane protein CusA/SilA
LPIGRAASPQEVEDQVTYPLSVNLQGLAGVKTVRASSMVGFSLVTIIFDDKIDNYFARSRVLERLNYLGQDLPLRLIVPAAIFVIFVLLFIVYHSFKEAAHVLLAVPFALTGGVYLQWLLGYNFSVAVWVGYIALFGTAIQTAVVMVVYLDEAVKKKMTERGTAYSRADLIQAVKDGARLRLRPEVMKPLATPVIGGMVSSLVCILIVTPVIFAWLREREMK